MPLTDQEPVVLTDKEPTKTVPCTGCERPCVVSKFAVAAQVRCPGCRTEVRGKGEQEVVQAGRTDPARAANLKDCLINQQFAHVLCPAYPHDPEHIMELKSVSHSERYGPSQYLGDGRFRQLAPGETVMHQCLACKAVVTYSTTAQIQFRRMNEVRDDKQCNRWLAHLGLREESR